MKAAKLKARHLRKNQTKAEALLWHELKNRKLAGFKFRRQYPTLNFILDFFCAEKLLCIELDGSHHEEKDISEYDNFRTLNLNTLGIKVLRFSNNDVFNDLDQVIKEISKHLKV